MESQIAYSNVSSILVTRWVEAIRVWTVSAFYIFIDVNHRLAISACILKITYIILKYFCSTLVHTYRPTDYSVVI